MSADGRGSKVRVGMDLPQGGVMQSSIKLLCRKSATAKLGQTGKPSCGGFDQIGSLNAMIQASTAPSYSALFDSIEAIEVSGGSLGQKVLRIVLALDDASARLSMAAA